MGYYKHLEDTYCKRLSPNRYIVVRLDGVDVSKGIDLYGEAEHDFTPALKKTCEILSCRLGALGCYYGSDEINFIFESHVIMKLCKKLECQKVSSIIAQHVYIEFNKHYNGDQPILFDARSFNLHPNHMDSYVKHRQSIVKNCQATHFAKKYIPPHLREGLTLKDLLELINKTAPQFSKIPSFFKEGEFIDLRKYSDFDEDIFEIISELG